MTHAYKRRGDVVYIGMISANGIQLSAGAYTTVATIPEGLRPSEEIGFTADNTGGTYIIGGRIETTGDVKLYSSGSTKYWRFNVSYIV